MLVLVAPGPGYPSPGVAVGSTCDVGTGVGDSCRVAVGVADATGVRVGVAVGGRVGVVDGVAVLLAALVAVAVP